MQFERVIIVIFILMYCIVTRCAASDDDAMRVFAEGYKKNRESFTNIDCKFVFTRALQTASTKDAINGHVQKSDRTASFSGMLLVKNGSTRFELKCEKALKAIAEKKIESINKNSSSSYKGGFTKIPCVDSVVISSDDFFRMTYSDIVKAANIFPRGIEEGEQGVQNSPFDMGVMGSNEFSNPYRYIQDCIKGRFTGRYIGTEIINGQQLEIVTFSTKNSNNQPRMKFGFDPNKGFLATYIADFDEETHKRIYEAFVLETKRCSGNRFFPMKSVVVFPYSGQNLVNQFVVTELDVDAPVDSSLLCVEIPKGSQMSVPSFKDQWMPVDENLLVRPEDIAQLQKDCIEYAKDYIKKHTTPPEYESNLNRANWVRTILMLVGLILIAYGINDIIRRWRKNR